MTQRNDDIQISTPLGPDTFVVRRMTGTEPLGRPFEFQLDLESEDHGIAASQLIGQNVTVRVRLPSGDWRCFNGCVRAFTRISGQGAVAGYRVILAPWLWLLTHASGCRIFQDKSVPEILKEVFRDHGFEDYEDALRGTYPAREYCVQYNETDFAFVSRLMEQEGIYYFFRHEEGRHCLVLADAPDVHQAYPSYEQIRYCSSESMASDEEFVSDCVAETCLQSTIYTLNAFDFQNTRKDLQARATIGRDHAANAFERYEYSGDYVESSQGETCARRRLEQIQSQHEVMLAKSNARGIATGCVFELTDHPCDDHNRKYLVTAASYQVSSGGLYSGHGPAGPAYTCSFSAIPATEAFRPEPATPRPQMAGPQTALVVGPEGEEIHTDKYGRIKVQFHWDRVGRRDQNSSCWMRVAQTAAGKRWGALSIPRIGQEVVVDFLGGDPDRPLITGCVYNGQSMPPYELPRHKTITTFKTQSTEGGGYNEIRFEDKRGSEQVFLHAERDLQVRVENDCLDYVGRDEHRIVENDRLEHVGNDSHLLVDASSLESVGKDRHVTVNGQQATRIGAGLSLVVQGDAVEVFGKNHLERTTGQYCLKAQGVVIEVMQSLTLKCGANSIVIDPSGVTLAGTLVTIDGAMTKLNSGPGSPPACGQEGGPTDPATPLQAQEADGALS